jgi:hypothetical protein
VHLDLQGIRSIGVEVTNTTPARHIETSELARSVALQIKNQGRRANVTAFPFSNTGGEDAILQVSVLSESATPASNPSNGRSVRWDFQISVSAVLTRKEGTVVWHEKDGTYRFSQNFKPEDEVRLWNEPVVRDFLLTEASSRLVSRMLGAR